MLDKMSESSKASSPFVLKTPNQSLPASIPSEQSKWPFKTSSARVSKFVMKWEKRTGLSRKTLNDSTKTGTNEDMHDKMSESSKASSPFVLKTPKQSLPVSIPSEQPKLPFKTSSARVSKFAKNWESRTGLSKTKLNDSMKTETNEEMHDKMSESSKASSPFVLKTPKQSLPAYIPMEQSKWPLDTSSAHVSKYFGNFESRTGLSKTKLNNSTKTGTNEEMHDKMSESSKASSPFVLKTPSQSLPAYIPLEQSKWPFKTSSARVSKFDRNWESRTGFSKTKLNDSTKTETSGNSRLVTPIKKNDWNKIGIIRLHEEMKAFYEAVLPQPKDQLDREEVIKRITTAVKGLWSGARVEVFGSFRTGLYLPSSDIDLVVFGCWKIKPLYTLKDELVRRGVCDEERTTVLDKASVPIIKMTDKTTGIKVDIAFNVTNGLTSAELIQGFLKEFPSLPYLVLVLKQFVYQRDINEVYTGGIGSYSLILLAVSFLQLQTRAEGRMVNVNYGVQLLEFFELYGKNFNYNRIGISVADGGKYIQKERDAQGQLSLYIQDPVCEGNDVARGTFNFYQIQAAFSHAYHTLCNEVLRARDDVFLKQRPILSSIIDFECDVEIPCDSFFDSNQSSQSVEIIKYSSTTSEIETPIRKPEQSFSRDSSKKSEKKRRHKDSMDFEKNKKRKHNIKDRSLSLLANETG